MRILWNSDKILGYSAYSKVTKELCMRLADKGYDIAHIPMGVANKMGNWVYKNILIYESGNDPFNEDVALRHYVDFKADIMVVLKDIWVLNRIHDLGINFVPYVPVDHSPVSQMITSRLQTAFRVITPSRHGQRELMNAGFTSTYIPHGVDSNIFRPLDKKVCKKLWYLDEDDFTVMFVGRNQSRKMIPRVLRAYKLFRERNPDIKSHMMLWTDVIPPKASVEGVVGLGVADVGVNLIYEIDRLGLNESVVWPDPSAVREGIPDWAGDNGQDMVKLYNAADVLISLSGEGFWLPGIEAQACGVPVICADYASTPEICGAGYTVPVDDYVILNTPGTRYPICSLDKSAEALTKIANADGHKIASRARSFAVRFDWDNVIEKYMVPFLEECSLELKPLITKNGVSTW